MMKYDLEKVKPEISSEFGCFDQNVLLPIAKVNGLNLDPYFLCFYPLNYSINQEEDINENRSLLLGNDFKYKILEEYCGIKFTRVITEGKKTDIDRIISEIENGNPVGISIDTFYCPWIESFQKMHIDHYVLLTSYDVERKKFICIDYYNTQDLQQISLDDIESHLYRIYWIKMSFERSVFIESKYKQIMLFSESFIPGHNSLQAFIDFKQDLINRNYQIVARKSFEYDNFLIRIKRMKTYRNIIAKILDKTAITEVNGDAEKLAEIFREESNCWEKIVKCLMKENFLKIDLSDKLNDLLVIIELHIKKEKILLGEKKCKIWRMKKEI